MVASVQTTSLEQSYKIRSSDRNLEPSLVEGSWISPPWVRGIGTTATRTERIGRTAQPTNTNERDEGDVELAVAAVGVMVVMVAAAAVAFATRWSLSVRAVPTLLLGASDPTNDVSTCTRCPHDFDFNLPRRRRRHSPPLFSPSSFYYPSSRKRFNANEIYISLCYLSTWEAPQDRCKHRDAENFQFIKY